MNIISPIREFARQIKPNAQLLYLDHRPEPGTEIGKCFRNVTHRIASCGGSRQMGWLFQNGKGFIIAIHHCIWRDPHEQLLDITPVAKATVVIDGKVVFLPDDAATLTKPPGFEIGVARPNRLHVYSNKADLVLVSKLLREEREWEQEFAALQELQRLTELEVARLRDNAAQRGGCGSCQACCEVLAVKDLNKPYWKRCEHQCPTGCAIYSHRPALCKDFYCSYLAGDTPADPKYRPDNLGVLFHLEIGHTADNLLSAVILNCCEVRPGAFAANPWIKQLADEIARKHGCPNMWWLVYGQEPKAWDDLGIRE